MKVMYVDRILFPAFVTNMAKLVFHLYDLYVDIRQLICALVSTRVKYMIHIYIYIYIYIYIISNA